MPSRRRRVLPGEIEAAARLAAMQDRLQRARMGPALAMPGDTLDRAAEAVGPVQATAAIAYWSAAAKMTGLISARVVES